MGTWAAVGRTARPTQLLPVPGSSPEGFLGTTGGFRPRHMEEGLFSPLTPGLPSPFSADLQSGSATTSPGRGDGPTRGAQSAQEPFL